MPCQFKYLLALDFETTSDSETCDYAYEIIQFSVAAYDVEQKKVRDDLVFNQYVRPVVNPVLSDHCSTFTGIDQSELDKADTFPVVYQQFLLWLENNEIWEKTFAIVCDSRQDMWRIAQYQMKLSKMVMPPFFRQYVSLWRVFENEQERQGKKELLEKTYIGKMLEYYGLERVGRAHDANGDCQTICRIIQKMLEKGAVISINEILVCNTPWRNRSLNLADNWRSDFHASMSVFERVMPLAVKALRPYDYKPYDYGRCRCCRQVHSQCGIKHSQYPAGFYASQREPVAFAEIAEFNKL